MGFFWVFRSLHLYQKGIQTVPLLQFYDRHFPIVHPSPPPHPAPARWRLPPAKTPKPRSDPGASPTSSHGPMARTYACLLLSTYSLFPPSTIESIILPPPFLGNSSLTKAKLAARNAQYAPHSHDSLTTHLIRRGALTITYPGDERPVKETFGVGSRVDVEGGRVHEVWMGDRGCEYVIGE